MDNLPFESEDDYTENPESSSDPQAESATAVADQTEDMAPEPAQQDEAMDAAAGLSMFKDNVATAMNALMSAMEAAAMDPTLVSPVSRERLQASLVAVSRIFEEVETQHSGVGAMPDPAMQEEEEPFPSEDSDGSVDSQIPPA